MTLLRATENLAVGIQPDEAAPGYAGAADERRLAGEKFIIAEHVDGQGTGPAGEVALIRLTRLRGIGAKAGPVQFAMASG